MWKFGVGVLMWPCTDRGLIFDTQAFAEGVRGREGEKEIWVEHTERQRAQKMHKKNIRKIYFFVKKRKQKDNWAQKDKLHYVHSICVLSIKLHSTCWPHFVFNRITRESEGWSPLKPFEKWIMAKKHSHKGKSYKQCHSVQYVSTVPGCCVPFTQTRPNPSCCSESDVSFL